MKIKEVTGCDRVKYDPHSHVLDLTIGLEDYHVSLHHFSERSYESIIPLLNSLNFRKLIVYISTRNTKDLNKHPILLTNLYKILKEQDKSFSVKALKGLGEAGPEGSRYGCIDPTTRKLVAIKGVGDVDTVFDLLGKSDSDGRQTLLDGQWL